MITPKLEELILSGKAFFKTFVAGGDKHTLTFGNDRFIIITDITYFPMNIETAQDADIKFPNYNTQVAIYGERGYNHYIFRNYNETLSRNSQSVITNGQQFQTPVTINTYILHEQQVGFSFCNAPYFINQSWGVANTNNPGYKPPIDWGIDGQPGAVDTTLSLTDALTLMQNNFTVRPSTGFEESQQLLFPFRLEYSFGYNAGNKNGFEQKPGYPLLLVNYVEVIGSPNNIAI